MIHLIKIEDLKDKWDIISQFQPEDTNFLVSDIKSKLALESFFLQKQASLTGHSIMRIQEFYKELFSWTHPDWKIVSKVFLGEIFIDFASSHESTWVKRINHSEFFFHYLDQFLPVLSHEEGPDLIKDWFKQGGSSAQVRWGDWYNLCEEFFSYIKEKKIFYDSGIKGLLVDQLDQLQGKSFLNQRIVVDLGINFNSLDQNILESLSKDIEVHLIVPFSKNSHFSKENNYSFLERDIPKTSISVKEKTSQSKTRYFSLKNATRLQEIKRAIAQIRFWLNSGVDLKDIALIAPHIEDYWFCLKPYFEKENIKIQKKSLISVKNFPEVMYWMSCIRYCLGIIKFSDLELISFYKNPRIKFSKFKSLYYNFPEKNSITYFKSKIKNPEEKITGRDFIDWILSLWPQNGNKDVLNFILQDFQNSVLDFPLRRDQWLRYLTSSTFLDFESEETEEETEGIVCLSFNAMNSVTSSHVFFLGLEEDALISPSQTGLTSQDKFNLLQELGFPLPFFYSEEQEFYLFCFLQSSFLKEVVLSVSQSNLLGDIKNISSFWLWFTNHQYCQPSPLKEIQNVWDNQKNQKNIDTILHQLQYKTEEIQFLKNALSRKKISYKNPNPLKLSYNSLNNYAICPFIYAGFKNFHLKDDEEVTMDISHLHFGTWVHKLLTRFASDDIQFSKDKIDQIKESENIKDKLSYEENWEVVEHKLEFIYKNLLKNEMQWRRDLPDLKIKGTEVKLEPYVYWNSEKSCLDKEGIPLSGSIDRIDFNSKSKDYALIDYKGGAPNNLNSWKSNSIFQLLLYASALEKGLIKGFEKGKIKALLYYSYKKKSLKGYIEKGSFYETLGTPRSKYYLKREELDHHFEWMNAFIQNLVTGITSGNFSPKPRDKITCKECKRRLWCRAAHLN